MTKRHYGYNVDSPEYAKAESVQKLFLILLLIALVLLALVLIVGTCAYFWGELGAKIAFITLGAILLILLSWFIVMASINRVSYIYRDAADTIVNFQAADDRGEVMRHLAGVARSDRQLDSNVLRLANSLAKGQARAIVQGERGQLRIEDQQRQQAEQDAVDAEWWNAPDFNEVD